MKNKDTYTAQEVAEMIHNRELYFGERIKGGAYLGDPDLKFMKELDRQIPKNVKSELEEITRE